MIKYYSAGFIKNPALPGATGIAGDFTILSPQRRLILLSVDIAFNSYNQATNELDNPLIDRLNYISVNIENWIGDKYNPFDAPHAITSILGTNYPAAEPYWILPGHYEFNAAYQDFIYFTVYSYNYNVANRFHNVSIFVKVDELPL